jgi:hypothetical protein
MNVMRRHVLRLVVVSAFTIAVPQLASAFDSETSAALKLAMGPTSAPQKNPGVPPNTPSHRAGHPSGHAQSRTIIGNTGTRVPPPSRSDRAAVRGAAAIA